MTKSNVFQFLYTPVRTVSVVQCNDFLNGSEKKTAIAAFGCLGTKSHWETRGIY